MRLNSIPINYLSSVSFNGIAERYKNADGVSVIPIAQNPNQNNIQEAIEITKSGKPLSGLNGDAFFWGEDLVVKKYKPEGCAINYDPSREINVLDSLFDEKIELNGSQKGMYAFETPDGVSYLVSTRVQGSTPVGKIGNLNKENLASIVDSIGILDIGTVDTKDGFRLQRLMHYDLSPENIKITNTSAGILDFEYMEHDNLDQKITSNSSNRADYPNIHFSDIDLIPSNLRGFEHRALYDYLKDAKNPEEIFNNYMIEKGKYYKRLGDFHTKCMQMPENKNEGSYYRLAQKEYNHSSLMKKAAESKEYIDIKQSEAVKIQIAKFLFDLEASSSTYGKANPKQVEEYIDEAKDFFNKNEEIARLSKDKERASYYSDCKNLISCWEGVKTKTSPIIEQLERGEAVPEKYNCPYIKTLDKLVV